MLRLIEAHYTPASDDPHGTVMDGYAVVEGGFGPVGQELEYCRKNEPTPRCWTDAYFDSPDDRSAEEEVFALKLAFSDWNLWHSLILKKSERVEGAYERVGFNTVGDGPFKGRVKSIIRIV